MTAQRQPRLHLAGQAGSGASPEANLHLVGDDAEHAGDPERVLAALFAREAQLLSDLMRVRGSLQLQRQRLAQRDGLRIYPAIDVLRRRLFA